MSFIVSVLVSLVLVFSGPALLWSKTPEKTAPQIPQAAVDLETAAADLQENTRDLRHNITSWRKIQSDSRLTPAEKKQWHDKANTYLQECEAYNDLLARIDAKKLPNSEAGRRFWAERQTFQRELQYFREILKMLSN